MKKYIFLLLPICLATTSLSLRAFAATAAHSATVAEHLPLANAAASISTAKNEHKSRGGFFKKAVLKKMARKARRILEEGGGISVAVLCYLTIIGWIIAYMEHKEKPTSLGGFHLAQTAGNALFLVGAVMISWIPLIGLVGLVIALLAFINWIVGLTNAINEKEKHMPIFGKLFENLFGKYFQ